MNRDYVPNIIYIFRAKTIAAITLAAFLCSLVGAQPALALRPLEISEQQVDGLAIGLKQQLQPQKTAQAQAGGKQRPLWNLGEAMKAINVIYPPGERVMNSGLIDFSKISEDSNILVSLIAGNATRFGGSLEDRELPVISKVIYPFLGRPLALGALEAGKMHTGITPIGIVGYQEKEVIQALGPSDFVYVRQPGFEQDPDLVKEKIARGEFPDVYGTGYASALVCDYIPDSYKGLVTIVVGDAPLFDEEILTILEGAMRELEGKVGKEKAAGIVLSSRIKHPEMTKYGRIIVRKDGSLDLIIESKSIFELLRNAAGIIDDSQLADYDAFMAFKSSGRLPSKDEILNIARGEPNIKGLVRRMGGSFQSDKILLPHDKEYIIDASWLASLLKKKGLYRVSIDGTLLTGEDLLYEDRFNPAMYLLRYDHFRRYSAAIVNNNGPREHYGIDLFPLLNRDGHVIGLVDADFAKIEGADTVEKLEELERKARLGEIAGAIGISNEDVRIGFNGFDTGFEATPDNCTIEQIPWASINDTFVLTNKSTGKRFVIQKVNSIFSIRALENNIGLHQQVQSEGLPSGWEPLYFYNVKGASKRISANRWQVMNYVDGKGEVFLSFGDIKDDEDRLDASESLGAAMVEFGRILGRVPQDKWMATRQPESAFAGHRYHFRYLDDVIKGKTRRLAFASAKKPPHVRLVAGILEHPQYAERIQGLIKDINDRRYLISSLDGLGTVVAQGDNKPSNYIYRRNPKTGKLECICPLDLHTIQRGNVLNGLGDALRSAANPTGEEPESLSDVKIDMEIVQRVVKGYLSKIKEYYGDAEAKRLAPYVYDAARLCYLEMCARFLANFLTELTESDENGSIRQHGTYFRLKDADPSDTSLYKAEVQMRALNEFETAIANATGELKRGVDYSIVFNKVIILKNVVIKKPVVFSNGVTINPDGASVELGEGAQLSKGVTIEGTVVIGPGVVIGEGANISNAVVVSLPGVMAAVGKGSILEPGSVVLGGHVGTNVKLRRYSFVGPNVNIANNSEHKAIFFMGATENAGVEFPHNGYAGSLWAVSAVMDAEPFTDAYYASLRQALRAILLGKIFSQKKIEENPVSSTGSMQRCIFDLDDGQITFDAQRINFGAGTTTSDYDPLTGAKAPSVAEGGVATGVGSVIKGPAFLRFRSLVGNGTECSGILEPSTVIAGGRETLKLPAYRDIKKDFTLGTDLSEKVSLYMDYFRRLKIAAEVFTEAGESKKEDRFLLLGYSAVVNAVMGQFDELGPRFNKMLTKGLDFSLRTLRTQYERESELERKERLNKRIEEQKSVLAVRSDTLREYESIESSIKSAVENISAIANAPPITSNAIGVTAGMPAAGEGGIILGNLNRFESLAERYFEGALREGKKIVLFFDLDNSASIDSALPISAIEAKAFKSVLSVPNVYMVILTQRNKEAIKSRVLDVLDEDIAKHPRLICLPDGGIDILTDKIPTNRKLRFFSRKLKAALTELGISWDEELVVNRDYDLSNLPKGKNYLIKREGVGITMALYRTIFAESKDANEVLSALQNSLENKGVRDVFKGGMASVDIMSVNKSMAAEAELDLLCEELNITREQIAGAALDDEFKHGYGGRKLLEFATNGSNVFLSICPVKDGVTFKDALEAPVGTYMIPFPGPQVVLAICSAINKAARRVAAETAGTAGLGKEAALVIGPDDATRTKMITKLNESGVYATVITATDENDAARQLKKIKEQYTVGLVVDCSGLNVDMAGKIRDMVGNVKIPSLKTRDPEEVKTYLQSV